MGNMGRARSIRIAVVNTIVAILVVVLAYSLTFFFSSRIIRNLSDELANLKNQEEALLKKKNELPNIVAVLPLVRKEAERLRTMFPPNPGDKELIDFLEQTLKTNRISVIEIGLSEPATLTLKESTIGKSKLLKDLNKDLVEKIEVINFNMVLKGRYNNFLRLLESLKNSGRFIRVERVSGPEGLKGEEFDPTALEWEIRGTMFFLPPEIDFLKDMDKIEQQLSKEIGVRVARILARKDKEDKGDGEDGAYRFAASDDSQIGIKPSSQDNQQKKDKGKEVMIE